MLWCEILIIIAAASFVLAVFLRYIYKRIKGLPTGDCQYCYSNGKNRLVKNYHKKYRKP